jgi:hypothetical protein
MIATCSCIKGCWRQALSPSSSSHPSLWVIAEGWLCVVVGCGWLWQLRVVAAGLATFLFTALIVGGGLVVVMAMAHFMDCTASSQRKLA